MGACSVIPVLGIFLGDTTMVILLAVLSGLALLVETARVRLPTLNRLLVQRLRILLKETEDRRVTGATYIAISALVAFLIFDKPVAIMALFFLALGDPVAALVGQPDRRIPGIWQVSLGSSGLCSSRPGHGRCIICGRSDIFPLGSGRRGGGSGRSRASPILR